MNPTPRRVEGKPGKRAFDLEQRMIDLAAAIIDVVRALHGTHVGTHIAGQLLRCGTSPAANYGEAQAAESRADFIHKMKVVLKELRETRVWLTLIRNRNLVGHGMVTKAAAECEELIAICFASIDTARKNLERSGRKA